MNFQGEIETQITLTTTQDVLNPQMVEWFEARGLKYVHIILHSGRTPSQHIVIRQSTGNLRSEFSAAHDLAAEIEKQGEKTCRIKLATAATHKDAPTKMGYVGFPRYFEIHRKILVPSYAQIEPIVAALKPRGWRLSHNREKHHRSGKSIYFATYRDSGRHTDFDSMQRSASQLPEVLHPFHILTKEAEKKYVIYDSNPALDYGWFFEIPAISESLSYPQTFRVLHPDTESRRPHVFEPALRHFGHAFQFGEPADLTSQERAQIANIRTEVRHHILKLIADSPWKDHLILRGSSLLQSWFGAQARDPKDIDLVFQPLEVAPTDPTAQQCLQDLKALVQQNPRTPHAEIDPARIVSDEIWTYDAAEEGPRAEGRRIVFPFKTDDGLEREIQIDIVWQEPVAIPPIEESVPIGESHSVNLWTATRQQSLVWKLMWIITDRYTQGKDIFDAVLLAENTPFTPEIDNIVLESIYRFDPWYKEHQWTVKSALEDLRCIDWENFQQDYPWLEGEFTDWKQRLLDALYRTPKDQS